jgi:hypothetical protein
MYRNELPRVYELRDMAQSPPSPKAYFHDFDNKLQDDRIRLKHFRDIEAELEGLDAAAWNHLKMQLSPLLSVRAEGRGWQPLFDKLNEAKGYGHLVSVGCTNVAFVPVSPVKGKRTPDLQGELSGTKVLCEVKTINISKVEATRRATGAAGTITLQLPEGFFNKLKSDLEAANAQMIAYDSGESVRRIVYIVVNFDDNLSQYADDYSAQINSFIAANFVSGSEIVRHIKPRYYSATV